MYTILVSEDNELITTIKERIMQRSKLVDNLHFLVPQTYKDFDMNNFTAMLEYITPVSRELHTEILDKSEELYKDHIEFKFPIDTSITKEAGSIELLLTFIYVEMLADGTTVQHVRKISPTTIQIIAVPAWCNIIPDSALSALDQRLIEIEAMMKAANEMTSYLDQNKADNIRYDESTNTLQLTANGALIGDQVTLKGSDSNIVSMTIDEDGNLIINYSDGRSENIGKVSGGACAGVYIPSYSDDGILTFTLKDKAEKPKYEFDIDSSNNWNPVEGVEQKSTYVWGKL